jgi:hypothetical protein
MQSNLIYGTQMKYFEDIKSKWFLSNTNSSLFVVNARLSWDLNFIKMMAIYHSIWIQNQHNILNWWYKNFAKFYMKNIELLPILLHFNKFILNDINIDKRYELIW